jgi:hypothetical protein
VQQLLL